MADRQGDPRSGRYLGPVVARRGFTWEPDHAGIRSLLVPEVQARPLEAWVDSGPQRSAVMGPGLQEVSKGLVEPDIQNRGALPSEGTDPGEG